MEENPTRVVIVSGSREPSQIERAERAGAMDYVVKPLEAHQIQPVLARAQRRFERCMRIRREAGNPEEAVETWLVARRAAKVLMETDKLSEDEAHDELELRAAERGLSLRVAAEHVAGCSW